MVQILLSLFVLSGLESHGRSQLGPQGLFALGQHFEVAVDRWVNSSGLSFGEISKLGVKHLLSQLRHKLFHEPASINALLLDTELIDKLDPVVPNHAVLILVKLFESIQ